MNCEKATLLITKEQEQDLGSFQKIGLGFHLLFCRFCKMFQKQSNFISKKVDHMNKDPESCMPTNLQKERKEEMEKAMRAELDNNPEGNH